MITLPTLEESRNPADLYADIARYIDEAQALVDARDIAPLAGLDTVVEALCQRIMALEAEEARTFGPQLETLVTRLDALQASMLEARDAIAQELKGVDMKKKASRAYANANTTKPGA